MTKKQGIRLFFFCALLSAAVLYLVGIFGIDTSRTMLSQVMEYNGLYEEEKNIWDGVFIGTSTVGREWIAPLAWEEYGMTVYPLQTEAQPIYFTTYILEETLKYQDIKFAVIDIRGIRTSALKPKEKEIRKLTDNLRFSKNRLDTVAAALDMYEKYYEHKGKEAPVINKWPYYFPFLKYHSRWSEGLSEYDFTKPVTDKKGYFDGSASPFRSKNIERPEIISEKGILTDLQKEVLDDIIAYGKEKEIELLFISSPTYVSEKGQKVYNAALEYIETSGNPIINFNTNELYDELGVDFSQDFSDNHHMNSKGAIKFTNYLGAYIKEHYDLKNKSEDERYKSWDEAYENFMEFYKNGWVEAKKK